jgi:hypothetical protein
MTLTSCSREKDVTELLALGAWPRACPPELRAHLDTCHSCRELVLVTAAFKRSRAQTAAAARLASPGALWWRAQFRCRQAAVERVGKPILGAQIFALTLYFLAAVTVVVTQAKHGIHWLGLFEKMPQFSSVSLQSLWPANLFISGVSPSILIPIVGTLILLSGALVYLVAERQ